MNDGFFVTELQIAGENKKTSSLKFYRGVNLVTGVSDTGKSYAFSCLEYLLGRSESPKPIPESNGYSKFLLEISTFDDVRYTILREKDSADVYVKKCLIHEFERSDILPIKLKANHSSKNDDNLSIFLLKFSKLEKLELKKKKGENRRISMRDVRKFTMIPEDRIITEKSPVYATGQYPDQPFYQSMFNYIISGLSNAVEPQPKDVKTQRTHIVGQIEFVNKEIANIRSILAEINLEISGDITHFDSGYFEKIRRQSESLLKQIDLQTEDVIRLKRDHGNTLGSINYKKEISDRFRLLMEHYHTDLDRLCFIKEGRDITHQLRTMPCPVCNGELHSEVSEDINFEASINKEILTIHAKIADIQDAINDLDIEINELSSSAAGIFSSITSLQNEISMANPVLKSFDEEMKIYRDRENRAQRAKAYSERLQYLINTEELLTKEVNKTLANIGPEENPQETGVEGFCNHLALLFENARYPGSTVVNFDFSYKVFDILLSGKPRGSFGKGYRAVAYSLFLIGVIDWVIKREIPFNPLLVLDSPLTTYHGKNPPKDNDESIPKNLETAFFELLSKTSEDRQIIVFDNKIPEPNLAKRIHLTYFSGDDTGERRGFIEV